MWTCLKQKNKTLQLRLSNAGKTEPQWCSQRKCLGITSHMNHCPTCWDIECDVKRFTHHYVAQRKPLSHCFQSVLLWMFRKLIFKLCNGVFSHLISKTNCNWFISKLAEKMGKAECRTQQRVMFITDCVCVCVCSSIADILMHLIIFWLRTVFQEPVMACKMIFLRCITQQK